MDDDILRIAKRLVEDIRRMRDAAQSSITLRAGHPEPIVINLRRYGWKQRKDGNWDWVALDEAGDDGAAPTMAIR